MLDVSGDSLHMVWGLEHHQVDDSDDKFWESPPRSNRLLQNIHEALRGYFLLLLLLLLFCCCRAITLPLILAFGLFGLFLGNPFDPLPPFSLQRSRYNLPKIESARASIDIKSLIFFFSITIITLGAPRNMSIQGQKSLCLWIITLGKSLSQSQSL
jgi:hypothetical protein